MELGGAMMFVFFTTLAALGFEGFGVLGCLGFRVQGVGV